LSPRGGFETTSKKISELNDHKKEFKGRIVGIDAAAGIMKTSEKVIEAYNLDFKLLASSGPAMTASPKDSIKWEKWIVVTVWRRHWMFGRWRLFSLFRADFEVQRLHMLA
jgi:glycine betaine/proline transport system substrate-binding protein